LTASYGSYLLCVLVTYDRSKLLSKKPVLKWIFTVLPYVQLPTNKNDEKRLLKSKKELLYEDENEQPDEKVPLLEDEN